MTKDLMYCFQSDRTLFDMYCTFDEININSFYKAHMKCMEG